MRKVLRELEEMVVDAWPASETSDLSGWLLRSSDGPTKRANSVAALAVEGELSLDERIASVEAWYRERGKAAVFQVGPSAAPKELDAALQARGYRETGQTAFAAAAPSRLPDVRVEAGVGRSQPREQLSEQAQFPERRVWIVREQALGLGSHDGEALVIRGEESEIDRGWGRHGGKDNSRLPVHAPAMLLI